MTIVHRKMQFDHKGILSVYLNFSNDMFALTGTEEWFAHFNFFFLKEYHWQEDLNNSEEQLLKEFFGHRVFIDRFLPSEKIKNVKEFPVKDVKAVALETMHGPFVIEHLNTNHFKTYKGHQLGEVLCEFKATNSPLVDWESHLKIVDQAFSSIEKYKVENDTMFYINKDWFNGVSDLLSHFHSIFEYFLLFVLINKTEKRILMLTYGSD